MNAAGYASERQRMAVEAEEVVEETHKTILEEVVRREEKGTNTYNGNFTTHSLLPTRRDHSSSARSRGPPSTPTAPHTAAATLLLPGT